MAVIRERAGNYQAIVRVKVDGHLYKEARTFRTERLAKDWASRLEADLKVNGVAQRVKGNTTLGSLLLMYLEALNAVKPVRRQMSWEINRLAEEFKDDKLTSISSKRLVNFGVKRAQAGAAGATVLHDLATVRACLGAAKPMFGIAVNAESAEAAIAALQRVGAAARSKSRERRPTSEELLALHREFERISSHPSTRIPMATILKVAIAFPRRLGELMDMRWEDFTGDQIILRDTKHPVAPRTETVPVPEDAASIFESLPKIDERMLPYNPESVSASFERACKRLSIEDLRFHDLRHEGITRLFDAGLSIQEVSMISGHKSWGMLKRYTHLAPKAIADKLRGTSRLNEWRDTL
jgi:integrase